jgi:hypothetical protein
MRFRNLFVGAIVCASMLIAAPAYAQNSAQSGYSKPAGSIQEQISTRNDPQKTTASARTSTATAEPDSGDLPFTGLDVGLIVAAGGVLLAMGLGIRRLSRTEAA